MVQSNHAIVFLIFILSCMFFDRTAATNIAEQSAALNEKLHYLLQEDNPKSTIDRGHLYYNMGNVFYQFQKYPLAILYYEKALKYQPRNPLVVHNLTLARKELAISPPITGISEERSFFSFSKEESLLIVSLCCFSLLLCLSLDIWFPQRLFLGMAILVSLVGFVFLLQALYLTYFSPIQGIIVHASLIYRGTDVHYPLVENFPIFPGTKVTVIDVLEEGKWIKILTPQGKIGYVSFETIRLI